jgi:cell division protein FtsN
LIVARSNSSGALKYIGAGVAAIIGGVAIGYLAGGARTPHTVEQAAPPPVPVVSTPVRSAPPPDTRLHAGDGNYTAPGAPRITIQEESAPTMRRVNRTVPTPPADTEASQEALPPAKSSSDQTPKPGPADTAPSSDTPTPPDSAPSDTPPPLPKDNSAPSSPAPADPDFEHVTKPAVPESGQQGVGRAPDSSGKAQYRVQTGAYTDEGNARSVSDQLRGEGYTTSTRSERQGDHLVYKVQAGAYRSKNGANRAAVDLQKKGFPAYVSPLTP